MTGTRDDSGPDPAALEPIIETQRQLGNVSRGTIYRLANKGEIALVKIGNRTAVLTSSRRDYVARQLNRIP